MKTTARQFRLFRATAEKAIKDWRIMGWNIYFYHEPLTNSAAARCATDYTSRTVSLYLSSTIKGCDAVTDAQLRFWARHEVAHLLCSPLQDRANDRYATEDSITEAGEHLANTLAQLLP